MKRYVVSSVISSVFLRSPFCAYVAPQKSFPIHLKYFGGAFKVCAHLQVVSEYFGEKGREASDKYFWENALRAYQLG